MKFVPAVKSHQTAELRWSNNYPTDIIQDLISPILDNRDSVESYPGNLISANPAGDLIYVSSDNTVSILLASSEESDLAKEVVLVPEYSDLQVFETQLSVTGITCRSRDTFLINTMYHVILLTKLGGYYMQELIYSSEEHILSVVQSDDGSTYIFTVNKVVVRAGEEITLLTDISDMWRVEPISRVTFQQYNSWFVAVELSAVHFIKDSEHHTVCTIPTEYLEFTEKFLNCTVCENALVTVTSSYLITFQICEEAGQISLELKSKLSHNVADAHYAQFYPEPVSERSELKFAVFSNLKCSFFNFKNCPKHEFITSTVPYDFVNLMTLQMNVLDKSAYLQLTVDKRNNITQRLRAGFSGGYVSPTNMTTHFILTKHKDLFYAVHDLASDPIKQEKIWNSWLSSVILEDQYWVDVSPAQVAFEQLLKMGTKCQRLQTFRNPPGKSKNVRKNTKSSRRAARANLKAATQVGSTVVLKEDGDGKREPGNSEAEVTEPVSWSRDTVLDNVEDKYANSLITAWDWG